MKIPFRQITEFPREPMSLGRALDTFEDNVAQSFRIVGDSFLAILRPTPRKAANYTAVLNELVTADTSAGSFTVTLPDASALNAGQSVAVVRPSAANTLTVRAPSTNVQGQVPNTGDAVPATVGLYVYISTGNDWWRR